MTSNTYRPGEVPEGCPAFRAALALPVEATIDTVWDVISRPDIHYAGWDKNVRSATLDTEVMQRGSALTIDFEVLPAPVVQNITSMTDRREIIFDSPLHGPIDEEGRNYGEIDGGLLRFHFALDEDPSGLVVIERGVRIWGPRSFAGEFGAYQAESMIADTRALTAYVQSQQI